MSARNLIGIDIGTTGNKTVLIDAGGGVLGEATREYPMATPRPGWSEQDPDDWWRSTQLAVTEILERSSVNVAQVAAIGLTGQMHGLVLLDGRGQALRPCIMWNDQRTAEQCARITDLVGADRLIKITGKPALTGFTAGKILWVRQHEPEVFKRVAHIQLPKDYVRYRLTARLHMDVTDASGTNLFDVGKRNWSKEITAQLRIPDSWLPQAVESSALVGEVSDEAARLTHLAPGTPVVAGAGDQAAQAIGAGITSSGIVSVTVGTSGVIFDANDSCVIDDLGRLHAYCHAVPAIWHLMGVTLAAGGSLRWLRDSMWTAEKPKAGQDLYEIIIAAAATIPAGAEGLIFLPYLSGERTPHPDPHARGVFFGLSLRHARAHMARAVLEGVAFSLKECLELLHQVGVRFDRVRISGGGAKSVLWRQIMADVFGVEVVEVNITQGAAYGAALLAGVGAGIFIDAADACARTIRETSVTKPGPDQAFYERLYDRYKALYPLLKKEYEKLSTLDVIRQ
jgi:xylulokinase